MTTDEAMGLLLVIARQAVSIERLEQMVTSLSEERDRVKRERDELKAQLGEG